jgi:hypothetical protein
MSPSRAKANSIRQGARRYYVRLLDAAAEGADWREVSRIVLHIDPDQNPEHARRAFDSHRARARWMSREDIAICYVMGGLNFLAILRCWKPNAWSFLEGTRLPQCDRDAEPSFPTFAKRLTGFTHGSTANRAHEAKSSD